MWSENVQLSTETVMEHRLTQRINVVLNEEYDSTTCPSRY
jgi:hypothetical protein